MLLLVAPLEVDDFMREEIDAFTNPKHGFAAKVVNPVCHADLVGAMVATQPRFVVFCSHCIGE
jgi:hypothetical protein